MKIFKFNLELDKKTLIHSLKSIGYVLVSLLLVAYFIYHTANGFQSRIETEPVFYAQGDKKLTLDAYIFRKEQTIRQSHNGIVSYLAKENEKVTDSTVIAKIYSQNTDEKILNEIEALDRQIDILSAVDAKADFFSDISHIENTITNSVALLTKYSQNGDYENVITSADELLINLSTKQLRTSSQKSFSDYITSLSARRDALSLSIPPAVQTVYAGSQGYFSRLCDGYEDYFDYDMVKTMSTSDFYELKELSESVPVNSDCLGKIISDFEWYFVCPAEHNMTGSFKEGQSYNVTFLQNMNITLPAYLERIVTDNEKGASLLIFRCDRMPDNFNYLRSQKVAVTISSVSGLKIPRSSVRVIDRKQFVYILVGNRVFMRSVTIIDEAGEYYYVSESSEPVSINGDTYYGLKQNDNVIIYGKDLYDQKFFK